MRWCHKGKKGKARLPIEERSPLSGGSAGNKLPQGDFNLLGGTLSVL